jgi:hypothetical protein
MEGRTQSEARQNFDSKLTPIRWSDLRNSQGESHTRQQITASTPWHKQSHDSARQRFTSRANFSAMSPPDHYDNVYDDNPDDYEDKDYVDEYSDSNATRQQYFFNLLCCQNSGFYHLISYILLYSQFFHLSRFNIHNRALKAI